MTSTMPQKSIRDLEQDDFLAEDILDPKGKVVLAKGTRLGPTHVNMLMSLRIFTVRVGTEAQVMTSGLIRSAAEGELDHMFARHKDDPLMMALQRAAYTFHTQGSGS